MPLDLAGLTEAFATQRAAIGLLSGVGAQVHLQVRRLVEALEAYVASIRAFTCVDALVLLKLARVAEALATHAAPVRLVLGMSHLSVDGQLPRAAQTLAAQRAVKLLAAVGRVEVGLHARRLGGKLRQVSPQQGARALGTTLRQVPHRSIWQVSSSKASVLRRAVGVCGAGAVGVCGA